MSTIKLTDAAKHYREQPHQIAAWNALQESLSPAQLSEFAQLYRAAPAASQAPFTPSLPFSYRVTPNIQYGELALWSESRRFKHQYQCDTAVLLCQFIEKARAHFGNRPVIITSGYRPPVINLQVGGSSRSEHLYSAPDTGAVDWYIDSMSVKQLQDWADKEWPYSLGYGAPKGFLHLGIRTGRPRVRWDY
jgi:hypothetical protein